MKEINYFAEPLTFLQKLAETFSQSALNIRGKGIKRKKISCLIFALSLKFSTSSKMSIVYLHEG